MSTGTGRVFKRKWLAKDGTIKESQYWSIQFPWGGRSRAEVTKCLTEADARKVLKRKFDEIARGEFAPRQDRVYLPQLVELVRAHYRQNDRRSFKDVLDKLKAPLEFFEGLRVSAFTIQDVNRFIDYRLDAGYARASVNGELRYLRLLFRIGKEQKVIAQIPVIIHLLEGENQRDGFIDPPDFETLLSKIEDEDARDLIEFLYWTGWRVRAGRNLEWNSVNNERCTITMTSALSKNKTPLELPLNAKLGHILDRRRLKKSVIPRALVPMTKRDAASGPALCRLVFHKDGKPIYLRKVWKEATEAAGFKGLMIHDLCRSFARNISHAGVNETVASKYMNRRTVGIYKLYRITDTEDLRQAGEALDKVQGERKVVKIDGR